MTPTDIRTELLHILKEMDDMPVTEDSQKVYAFIDNLQVQLYTKEEDL